MRRSIRPILNVARDEECVPYLFRMFESQCDYRSHSRYLKYSSEPQFNIWADDKPVSATCLLHLGRAVVEASRSYPDAVLAVVPWQRHPCTPA